MTDELDELEQAIKDKKEDTITSFTLNHSNAQLVKIRGDYQTKF